MTDDTLRPPATSRLEAPSPIREISRLSKALHVDDAVNETCPWSGKPVAADSLTRYAGAVVGFCNPGCRDKFDAAVRHFEAALAERRLVASGGGE